MGKNKKNLFIFLTIFIVVIFLLVNKDIISGKGNKLLYSCTYQKSPSGVAFPFPLIVEALIDIKNNKVLMYKEDGEDLTKDYKCYKCTDRESRQELQYLGIGPYDLPRTKEARIMELESDGYAHLYKPTLAGHEFHCEIREK